MVAQPVPLPASLLAIPGVRPLELEVREVADLGPRMRRIVLTGDNLRDFAFQPGQDVMLVLDQQAERPLSRRYTIRAYDPKAATLELNIVAHGVTGPGARWASQARPGDRINGVGPRGKIFLDESADWHLFFGDLSAAPASLAMLEAVQDGQCGAAYLEVVDDEDRLPSETRHEVRWIHGDADLLQTLRSVSLPAGTGHVYIAGEVKQVATLKDAALTRGLAPERVSAKAYWGLGRANANRGEPD